MKTLRAKGREEVTFGKHWISVRTAIEQLQRPFIRHSTFDKTDSAATCARLLTNYFIMINNDNNKRSKNPTKKLIYLIL